MARPRRLGNRLTLNLQPDIEELLAEVQQLRAATDPYAPRPLAADLWREAIARGLAAMKAELVGNTVPKKPAKKTKTTKTSKPKRGRKTGKRR